MRDQHDAAGIVAQEFFQPGRSLGVEMVGGLVEQQDFRLGQQQFAQRHAAALAARKLGHIGVRRRAAQCVQRLLDLAVQIPQVLRVDLVLQRRHLIGGFVGVIGRDFVVAFQDLVFLGHALLGVAQHVLVRIERRLLGEVAELDAVGRPGLAGEIGGCAGHDLQQRGLTRAVQADDADFGAGIERQVDVLQNLLAARIGLGQTLHVIDELGIGHGSCALSKKDDVVGWRCL